MDILNDTEIDSIIQSLPEEDAPVIDDPSTEPYEDNQQTEENYLIEEVEPLENYANFKSIEDYNRFAIFLRTFNKFAASDDAIGKILASIGWKYISQGNTLYNNYVQDLKSNRDLAIDRVFQSPTSRQAENIVNDLKSQFIRNGRVYNPENASMHAVMAIVIWINKFLNDEDGSTKGFTSIEDVDAELRENLNNPISITQSITHSILYDALLS